MVDFYILRTKKRSGGRKREGTTTLLDIPFIAESNTKLTIIHGLDPEGKIQVPGQSQCCTSIHCHHGEISRNAGALFHSCSKDLSKSFWCREVKEESRHYQADSQKI